MNFDTRTVVLVVQRLLRLMDNPPLFHERKTPAIVRRRLNRIQDWIGEDRCFIINDYLRRREVPANGKRDWARAWRRSETSVTAWQKPEALDTNREAHCKVSLPCGHVVEAYWTRVPFAGGVARAWLCQDDPVLGQFEVEGFLVISSLPFSTRPGVGLSDAELLADALGQPVDEMPAYVSRKRSSRRR